VKPAFNIDRSRRQWDKGVGQVRKYVVSKLYFPVMDKTPTHALFYSTLY